MPSSVGWRISSPDTRSKGESGEEESAPHDDQAEVPGEVQVAILVEGAPHMDEEQVQGEAEREVEREVEEVEREVEEPNDAEIHEIVGVDGRIKSGALFAEVEDAEIDGLFPLLGLLGFITATSPRVI